MHSNIDLINREGELSGTGTVEPPKMPNVITRLYSPSVELLRTTQTVLRFPRGGQVEMLLTTRCVCAHGSLELVRRAAAAHIGGKVLMYGVSMLCGLMTGAGEQENPARELRWHDDFR